MEVVFQNHAGKALPLTRWPLMLQDEEKLLKVSRSYASTERRTEGITIDRWFKRGQEFSLTVSVFADSAPGFYRLLDELETVTASDISARKPGRLYVNGRSYLPAYLSGWEVVEWDEDAWSTDLTLTVLSPYPYWMTETTLTYLPVSAGASGRKAYPYRYPHRYGNSLIRATLTNPANAPCGFRMVVFSVILMVVVLFFRKGIMGDREFSWDGIYGLLKKLRRKKAVPAAGKEAASKK